MSEILRAVRVERNLLVHHETKVTVSTKLRRLTEMLSGISGIGVSGGGSGGGRVVVGAPPTGTAPAAFTDPFRHTTIAYASPAGWNTNLSGFGLALAPAGTASIDTFATTNFATSTPHVVYTTSAATNQSAGWVATTGNMKYWRGNAVGLGGFRLNCRFALKTAPATAKAFFGMRALSENINFGFTTVANFVDCIGFGWDPGQSTFRTVTNGSGGAATEVDTGVAWATGIVYEVEIVCLSNAADLTLALYSCDGVGRTLLYTVVISSALPTSTAGLAYVAQIDTASTAAAVAIREYWTYLQAAG